MIRKKHNRTLQTNSRHREEEPQNSASIARLVMVTIHVAMRIRMVSSGN